MSSKKAMKLAQKQAYAKHRSNITNSRFGSKKINFTVKLIRNIKILIFLQKLTYQFKFWRTCFYLLLFNFN